MSILGAVIVPHPPLIIPTVGRGREQEVQATIDAYRTAAKQAVDALECGAVFVASGNLSHKLKDDGPYGYAPERSVFDHQVTQVMAGALDGLGVEAKLLSYEGVIGVGYGVATFAVTGLDENRRFGEQCETIERTRLAEKKASEDPWVKLARLSLETFVKTGRRLEHLPDGLPSEMINQAAGAFVSLH